MVIQSTKFVATFVAQSCNSTIKMTNMDQPLIAEKVKSQMRKGMLEFCVLLLISKGEVYASEIISQLKEAHMIVVEGTLYPLLSRLKKDGLLTYRWEESPSGPPRKYYSITDLGLQFLSLLHDAWREVAQTISHIENQGDYSTDENNNLIIQS